jgi:hypothetical protein
MTEGADGAARSYRKGSWFGILGEHGTVLLPASEKARVAAVWELADAGAGFDELLDALIASGLRGLPGFVLMSNGDDTTRVLLRGEPRAVFRLADGDIVEIDGGQAATWVERSLSGVVSAQLLVAESESDVDFEVDGGLVRVSRIDQPPHAGPVDAWPGSTALPEPADEPERAEAPAPAWVAQVLEHDAVEPAAIAPDAWGDPETELMATAGDAPAFATDPLSDPLSDPLPAEGHVHAPPPAPSYPFPPPPFPPPMPPPQFDPTDIDHDGHTVSGGWDPNQFARQQPGIPGQPPAPSVTAVPVARLVFSNGETIDVDRAVLVGRAPEARRFTSTEQPRLVTVPSPNQEISSTHLEVRPGSGADHGSAVVTDMGSTNGSVLTLPGLAAEDLQPGIAVQLVPGSVIDLGDGVTIHVTNP